MDYPNLHKTLMFGLSKKNSTHPIQIVVWGNFLFIMPTAITIHTKLSRKRQHISLHFKGTG